MNDLGDLCGYAEAATLLGIPRGTLYSWVHDKRVPHIRLGPRAVKFSRADLQRWIDGKRVNVGPAGSAE